MSGLAALTDDPLGTLAGVTITASGLALFLSRPRVPPTSLLLTSAGVTWLAPVVQLGGVSTLFVHRVLLAGALASVAVPRWWRRPAVASLAVFGAVCLVPAWATRPWLDAAAWGAVLVSTAVMVWSSPRRGRVLPALGANAVMMAVATFGVEWSVLTAGERRLVYDVAAAATALLVLRAARSPIAPEVVLEAGGTWSVGVCGPGDDHFVTLDGQRLDPGDVSRATLFDVGELGRAALVHDDPAFDDPRVRDRLQVPVRILAERAALLRRIDRQAAEVQLSRQRLLDADDEASLAMIEAVERNVEPHLDAIDRLLRDSAMPDDDTVGLLTEVRDEVRSLCSGTSLAQLEHGLGHALRLLGGRSPVLARVQADEPDLSPAAAHALFMVASEAAANAAKHSLASQLTIELIDESRRTVLRVTDDGRGGVVERPDGGLMQARRRLVELDGSLEVSTRAGETVVTASLPR